jgi:hypothetical protein
VSPFTPDQRKRWVEEVAPQLYSAVQEIQELPTGYALRLPSDPEILLLAAEELNFGRLCCPFVHYALEIEPNRGPFWLRMTGGEGVKAFLRMSLEATTLIDEAVANTAGFSVSDRTAIDSVETALETVDRINKRFAGYKDRALDKNLNLVE